MFSFIKNLFSKPTYVQFPSIKDYPYFFERKAEFDKDERKGGILFVGDSITDNFRNVFPDFFNDRIRNYGIAGDTTVGVVLRLDSIIKAEPEKLFILIGTNNIGARVVPGDKPGYYSLGYEKNIGKIVNTLISDYSSILKILTAALPDCKIYVQSILPFNNLPFYPGYEEITKKLKDRTIIDIFNTNTILENLARMYNCEYVDLFSHFIDDNGLCKGDLVFDGLHPSKKGYEVWLEQISPLL